MNDLQKLISDEVLILLRERHVTGHVAIEPDTSLVEDLGLDSLAFVDLTLRLEAKLGVRELPLQDWIDAEVARPGRRYTLGSLSDYANDILSGQAELPHDGSGISR
jgi:acyl carrier protein